MPTQKVKTLVVLCTMCLFFAGAANAGIIVSRDADPIGSPITLGDDYNNPSEDLDQALAISWSQDASVNTAIYAYNLANFNTASALTVQFVLGSGDVSTPAFTPLLTTSLTIGNATSTLAPTILDGTVPVFLGLNLGVGTYSLVVSAPEDPANPGYRPLGAWLQGLAGSEVNYTWNEYSSQVGGPFQATQLGVGFAVLGDVGGGNGGGGGGETPEPATFLLMGGGLTAVAMFFRRKRA